MNIIGYQILSSFIPTPPNGLTRINYRDIGEYTKLSLKYEDEYLVCYLNKDVSISNYRDLSRYMRVFDFRSLRNYSTLYP